MKGQRFLRSVITMCLAVLCLAVPTSAQQLDRSAEIARHWQALDAVGSKARIDNLRLLARSGITDEVLFDEIERRLLERYTSRSEEYSSVDETAWQAVALGASGLEKYRATLKKIAVEAPVKKVRTHAAQAEENMGAFARRNADMSRRLPEAAGLSTEHAMLYSLLRSGDVKLRTDAAKIITRTTPQVPLFYAAMDERVRAGYMSVSDEQGEEVDEIAWYCKALATSTQLEHRELIVQVSKGTKSKKLYKVVTGILGESR